MPHRVDSPARQGPVVHIPGWRVVQPGDKVLAAVQPRRHLGLLAGVVEGPVEADQGRVGVHLAAQGHCLVLESAEQLLAGVLAHWHV